MPAFVPLGGETCSQEADELTVHPRVPVPRFATDIVCNAGLLPPGAALKDRELGLTPSVGGVTFGKDTEVPFVNPGTRMSWPLSLV